MEVVKMFYVHQIITDYIDFTVSPCPCFNSTHTSVNIPYLETHTHPLSDGVCAQAVADNLGLLPEDSVWAPTSDLLTRLHSKHQQDDQTHEYQDSQDDGYDLKREGERDIVNKMVMTYREKGRETL
jgi:hypothetical protein